MVIGLVNAKVAAIIRATAIRFNDVYQEKTAADGSFPYKGIRIPAME